MRRSPSAILLVLSAIGGAGVACSEACTGASSTPSGSGDTVFTDVEASTLPTEATRARPGDANADPDGVFAPVDGSGVYGSGYGYDASAVRTICAPSDAAAGPSGTKGDGGAKPDAAGYPSSAGDGGYAAGDAGCEPFPSACANEPDCVCLLGALASEIPCLYPYCGVDPGYGGFSLYCPP